VRKGGYIFCRFNRYSVEGKNERDKVITDQVDRSEISLEQYKVCVLKVEINEAFVTRAERK
jgi:hypothetical protein